MHLRHLTELADKLPGKRVLLRGSLNLPIRNGEVVDTFRLQRMLPTLEYLKAHKAKTILLAHIGREVTDTLKPVYEELMTKIPVTWGGVLGSDVFVEAYEAMHDGDILLVENLRQDERETQNDTQFAQELAALGDYYVNDAFGNAHREHASMVGVPQYLPAYAGINLAKEVEELGKVMKPQHPSLFMLGGAKFETKLPLIEKYLDAYEHIFIGGALANDILKARGYPVGQSLLSDITLDEALVTNDKILIPVDVTVESERGQRVCALEEVAEDESIKDAGPKTVNMLRPIIDSAETILWNGPLGEFEKGYMSITEEVARYVAHSKAYSVIGGGDTIAAIENLGINDQFDWLSTGGGSMLTFLEYGSTPAIDLLRKNHE
ncbi:MAG: phosphoglycerate kinase [Patescibacteria group bacterium]